MSAELHPEARAVLDRQRRLGVFPLHEHGVRRLRLGIRVSNWFTNRNPPPVGEVQDRAIPGPGGEVPVRVYRPAGRGPFPTVVFFHGGGFVLGGLDSHDLLCRHLARETDAVVLAVDYRLAPEHPFPAAVEDAYAATRWADAHPDRLAGDGNLAVVGDSAGGTLAAVVSLMASERDGPDLDYQVLVYPGVGIEDGLPSVAEHDGVVLSRGDLEWFRDCYFDSDVHLRNPYADPANPADRSGVAPATVLTAGFDPLRDGGRVYAELLERDGVLTRYVCYEDVMHGFASMLGPAAALERAHEAVADVAGDLRDAFDGYSSA